MKFPHGRAEYVRYLRKAAIRALRDGDVTTFARCSSDYAWVSGRQREVEKLRDSLRRVVGQRR